MRLLLLISLAALAASAQEGWWMREPIRWIQTNLRETDAALDPERLVNHLADFRANTLLIGMGGITAYYPTRVEFHYASPHMPPGRDMFGEVLRRAHARNIRVVGRFDLSKSKKEAFDTHPEWFFKRVNGQPVIYNGLYSTCINGGYYSQKGMEILAEALDRYDVDGLFFNMFGNQSSDYSGNYVGICQCDECKRRFRERFRRELPKDPDADHQVFMFESSRRVAAEIGKLIHAKRPRAGYFNYLHESTDGIMSESNTAVKRALPLWPYTSSDNVNRARNSQPGKMAVNLCMSFVDYMWRFATVPPNEIRLRLWQNVANGGAAALNMHGTTDQQDRQALDAARPIYQWLAENEQYLSGQQSAARVVLMGRSARTGQGDQNTYRGLFRLLSEEHIPFGVTDNVDWIGKRDVDLVLAGSWVPKELEAWVRKGGRLIVASSNPPPLELGNVVKRWKDVQGYIRVRDKPLFPSLKNVDIVMLNGEYTEVDGRGPLTFIPPSMYGPPEKVHVDMVETEKPGLIVSSLGSGKVAWLPWDIAALYFRHSLPAHAGILRDLIDSFLPDGRQIKTNAHPLVEMTLMKQQNRQLLHLINLTGHSQTGYFDALPVSNIEVQVSGQFARARALRSNQPLNVRPGARSTSFILPALQQYELIVLE